MIGVLLKLAAEAPHVHTNHARRDLLSGRSEKVDHQLVLIDSALDVGHQIEEQTHLASSLSERSGLSIPRMVVQ